MCGYGHFQEVGTVPFSSYPALGILPKTVLYLHGFNSHPESYKAQVTRQACLEHSPSLEFVAPQLFSDPMDAYKQVVELVDSLGDDVMLIGSSFGGFLATVIAEKRDIAQVVLINPAINPVPLARTMLNQDHVNPSTGSTVRIQPHFIDELEALEPPVPRQPSRYKVLLGGKDELLDPRDALRFYRGSRILMLPNEGHALDSYSLFIPRIFDRSAAIA